MKIKRLTAALAVAALAAGFTLASPMLSARAATPVDWTVTAPDLTAPSASTSDPLKNYDIKASLLALPATTAFNSIDWWNSTTPGTPATMISINGALVNPDPTWAITKAIFVSENANASQRAELSTTASKALGTLTWSGTGLTFTPAPGLGLYGDVPVTIYYQMYGSIDPNNNPTQEVGFAGYVHVTVTQPTASGCGAYSGAPVTVDLQAWGKYDDPVTAKIELVKPNVASSMNKTGGIPSVDQKSYFVMSVDDASSSDSTLSLGLTGQINKMISFGSRSTAALFTAPVNWSGENSYKYAVAQYDANSQIVQGTQIYGCLDVTVHPTLTAPDPIVSDPGADVTIPLLGTGSLPIIGSKPFANASCVFASNNKVKDTSVGVITNKKGTKNPVFTPNADFVGAVDLLCTVEDTWSTVSNAVTVTIQVGAVPEPAPAAPATPSCGDSCNGGKLVSTGGSLATPMSSGLAAVVLLVAAGAGILVVRRRTSLAG